jgi:hypothetical protein
MKDGGLGDLELLTGDFDMKTKFKRVPQQIFQ